MNIHWLGALSVIVFGFSVSIYYFLDGFLLTRVQLSETSKCNDFPSGTDYQEGCWGPKQFSKAVIIVVDALRFDFMWSSAAGHRSSGAGNSSQYYLNQMPAFRHLALREGWTTLFYEGVADPPTTTMQRLKALTTGVLPTFIDVGSNFNSGAVNEDNWVAQLGGTGAFVGDDTWGALFPEENWAKAVPFPSFDVKDLNTVDAGVEANLLPMLRRSDEWSVLVAHFLGVDHVGHKHGPGHPVMAAKMAQLSAAIDAVAEELPPDTLLVVLGDHGMTEDGNHGGASDDEVSAGMMLHYKRSTSRKELASAVRAAAKLTSNRNKINNSFDSINNNNNNNDNNNIDEDDVVEDKMSGVMYRKTWQVDLVPTLSMLLGLPIPFGNIGMVLPEPFLLSSVQDGDEYLRVASRANYLQILRYLTAYSERVPSFTPAKSLTKEPESTAEYYAAQTELAAECRRSWATFNMVKVLWGAVVAGATAFALLCVTVSTAVGVDSFPMDECLYGIIAGICCKLVTGHSDLAPFVLRLPVYAFSLVSLYSVGVLREWHSQRRKRVSVSWSLIVPTAAIALHCAGLFSNSYIESDSTVARFIVMTIAVLSACHVTRVIAERVSGTYRHWLSCIALCVVSRVASELGPLSSARHAAYSTHPELDVLALTIVPLICLVWCAKRWLWKTTRTLPRVMWELGALCAGTHWFVQRVMSGGSGGDDNRASATLALVDSFAARGAFALAFVSLVTLVVLLLAANKKSKTVIVDSKGNSVPPQINTSIDTSVVEYGAFVAVFGLIVALVTGPAAPLPLLLMLVQCHLTADVIEKGGIDSCVLAGVMMAFTGIQYFFATGHSYLFSDIQFDAAFVGLDSASIVVGGALVVVNTVGAPMLAALSLPMFRPKYIKISPYWWLYTASLSFLLVFGSACASSIIFVSYARRHLMVWRVFCPKMLYDAVLLIAAAVTLLLNYSIISIPGITW